MGPLQLIILINLFTIIGLSLWAHFKGENKSKIMYFFTAVCGEFLLIDELVPFLGGNNFLISIAYLSISIAIFGYTLVIPHVRQSKKLMNDKLAEKVPDELVSNFPDEHIQRAHQLLDEE